MKLTILPMAALACTPLCATAQSDIAAKMVCKQFVERSLDDPSGADLSEWADGYVKREKNGSYTVQFRGRARNGFNALRLVIFQCQIRYKGNDDWSAISVKSLPAR